MKLLYMEDIVWTLLYLSSYQSLSKTFVTGTGLAIGESMILLCPGGQHTLVCSTIHLFLEWSVRTTTQPMLYERTVPSSDRSPLILPIRVNTANITFSRDSPCMVLPLVSTMTIENVNSYLEGTMINCTGVNSSSVSNIVFLIIMTEVDAPSTPDVIIRTDMTKFGNNNNIIITVTLEWSQFSGETYSVATIPEPVHMSFIVSNSVQPVLHYNTQYNLIVIATLCGFRTVTTDLMIYYVDCGAPQVTCDNIIISVNYSSTLEGSTLQFSCVKGYLPSDVFTATCHPNGSWVPDPTSHVCTGMPSMEQNQNTAFVTTIVIPNLVVYILSSVLIFIARYACGWFGHKHKVKGLDKNTDPQAPLDPVYEDLQPSMSMQGIHARKQPLNSKRMLPMAQ